MMCSVNKNQDFARCLLVLLRESTLSGKSRHNLGTVLLQGTHNLVVTLEPSLSNPQVYYHDACGLFLSGVMPFARLPLTHQ